MRKTPGGHIHHPPSPPAPPPSQRLTPLRPPRRRSALSTDPMQFGDGTTRAQLSVLPATLRPHLRRLRRSVYVYQMPASVNRAAEAWMWRQWGKDAGRGCDPVHNRRIYSAQSHFDAHLLHDDFTRTLDPKRASLFYVPLFLNQRVPWGADLNASMSRALAPSPFPQARDLPPEPSRIVLQARCSTSAPATRGGTPPPAGTTCGSCLASGRPASCRPRLQRPPSSSATGATRTACPPTKTLSCRPSHPCSTTTRVSSRGATAPIRSSAR